MQIYIDEFDENLTTWGNDSGYLIKFRSDLTSGYALLVADHSVSSALRGREISVETGQRDVVEVHPLLPEEPRAYRMTPLPEAGDYEAVGNIDEETLDEGNGFNSLYVYVGDARFVWTTQDVSQRIIKPGDWIRFKVIGLALWDTNT